MLVGGTTATVMVLPALETPEMEGGPGRLHHRHKWELAVWDTTDSRQGAEQPGKGQAAGMPIAPTTYLAGAVKGYGLLAALFHSSMFETYA